MNWRNVIKPSSTSRIVVVVFVVKNSLVPWSICQPPITHSSPQLFAKLFAGEFVVVVDDKRFCRRWMAPQEDLINFFSFGLFANPRHSPFLLVILLVRINALTGSEEAMRYLLNERNRINISMIQSSPQYCCYSSASPVNVAGNCRT